MKRATQGVYVEKVHFSKGYRVKTTAVLYVGNSRKRAQEAFDKATKAGRRRRA